MSSGEFAPFLIKGWLSKVDEDSISIILSFLPLLDQLQFRLVSTNFNELVMERNTLSKIVFDFIKLWKSKISLNSSEPLQFTFGAHLRCNGFIRNQQLLNNEDLKRDFNENELKLFQNGIVEITEMIDGKGLCYGTYFSFCKVKWIVNNNNELKTITFVQTYLQSVSYRSLELYKDYTLQYYEDDNVKNMRTIIHLLSNDDDETFTNYEILEKLKNKYCNQLVTNNLEEFYNFLLKLTNSKQTINSFMNRNENFKLNNANSNVDFSDNEINVNCNQFHLNGAKEMEQFIFNYDWKKLPIFCNGLVEIIHQMKSIALNINEKLYLKDSEEEDNDEELSDYSEEEELYDIFGDENGEEFEEEFNYAKSKLKLYKICDSKLEDSKNNYTFDDNGKEFKENREVIFYLSNLNKFIKIKAIMKLITLDDTYKTLFLKLFYKELNDNDWNCFYSKDNFNKEIKNLYFQKEMNRPKRPPSAYQIFKREQRDIVTQQNPEMAEKEIFKRLAEMWKSLDYDEKIKYQEQADELKNKYRMEIEMFEKGLLNDEESEENKECKKRKLNIVDIFEVKKMFKLENISDRTFVKVLINVMRAYRLVIDEGNIFIQNNTRTNEY
ncbi:hypothetical protein ABK040_015701 [Willaertia magna]